MKQKQKLLFPKACIVIDVSLLWNVHISSICSKLNNAVFATRKVKKPINQSAARLHITYCLNLSNDMACLELGGAWTKFLSTKRELFGLFQVFILKTHVIFRNVEVMTLFSLIICIKLMFVEQNVKKCCRMSEILEKKIKVISNSITQNGHY